MGIKSLMTLIMKKGQRAVEEINIEELKGCTVAFDATMTMYQFLISTTGIGKDGKLRVLGTKKDGYIARIRDAYILLENQKMMVMKREQDI